MKQTTWDIGLNPVASVATVAAQQTAKVVKAKAVKAVAEIPDQRTTIAGGLVTSLKDYRAWWVTLVWARWGDEQRALARAAQSSPQ
jgi:hypothetical protein